MRGARFFDLPACDAGRIIPADAGSTPGGTDDADAGEDHPRGCGEHTIGCPSGKPDEGSSPRMRGAPWWVLKDVCDARIIPADAGSTQPTD